ncbi:GCN5-related N-acetyltransferase [Fomitiporia mediterranea MF3/22]|uniref:GCN5-related N-acetyltransferase n=1 Tax=Fomitiporia mediterranea (strain MF3/22) TaxID=694068 RepID=UPI0004408984|nr:GCN5-related N-acetyltransferase [Fomitiporia mediterranea MF3/22]EJD03664.1 GCN5-related N-acetyltransferase [Fomitiporia mediterranea MF3/22]
MAGDEAPVPAYTIRAAEEHDLLGIMGIYNEQIENSTAIALDEPFDLENRRAWMRGLKAAGFPMFVAVPSNLPVTQGRNFDDTSVKAGSTVLGFAYYGSFRSRWGYRFSVEEGLYTHKSARGTGIGSALMTTLLDHAKKAGNVHVLVATITADNVGSIRFHERFGFEIGGTLKEVVYKFGKWQDVVFMQLIVQSESPEDK